MKFALALLAALALAGCRQPHTNTGPVSPSAVASDAEARPARLWDAGTEDVAVIMYHDVVPRKEVWFDLTVAEFEAQMQAIQEAGATVVSLDEVVRHLRDGAPLPPKAVALTFDDGTLGLYDHAWPILKRLHYPATFFVHTDYVGVKSSKDHLTWDQMRELKESGLIDIQPHTASHPEDLRKLSDAAVRAEFAKSNALMEQELGIKAGYLAYPSGHADERIARLVEEAGYTAAWNEERAWNASPADRFHLPRFAPFRLDEILAGWEEGRPSRPRILRAAAGQARPGEKTSEGPMDYTLGAWELDGAGRALLSDSGFEPWPDARQHGSIGLPIAVVGPGGAALAEYQPWLGVEAPALDVLLPSAQHAALGRAWLVRGGQEVAYPFGRGVTGSRVLGFLEDGRPFTAWLADSATPAPVKEALVRIGARDAALFD